MSTANAFIIVNLGCEMLYVIDQRLKAQSISPEKSAQVLRDLTNVLLDPKLIMQLINPHPCQAILSSQQCRILLSDIACCSLMRLDMTSMDKLWDLMVMLFKWQLFLIRENPNRLLEFTFRHMDGVAKIMPDLKKSILIDGTKRCLMEYWETCTEDDKRDLLTKLISWTRPFNVKISILIRLSFQRNDASFDFEPSALTADLYQDYIDNVGENVYAKSKSKKSKLMDETKIDIRRNRSIDISNELNTFASQLNIIETESKDDDNDDESEGNFSGENRSGSAKSSSGNVLLLDDVNYSMSNEIEMDNTENTKAEKKSKEQSNSEFIHLKKTQTALQSYLEQFKLESKQNSVDGETTQTFDATSELLKMLDDEKKK